MPWFRIDDGFHSHPKRLAASLAAVGLWTVAGSWSSAHLTDGVVPDHVLPLLSPDAPKLAEELAAAGLWRRRKGGYQFHDWADRNPTKTKVKSQREANAERQRKWRENTGAKQETAGQEAERNGVTNAATDGVTNGASNSAPTRPDPKDQKIDPLSPPSGSTSPKGGRQRATRLPADFTVTPEMVAWAREHVPRVDGRRETEKFINHWNSASGANARKLDWKAAWRNWMYKADDDTGRQPNGHPRPARNDPNAKLQIVANYMESIARGAEHDA